MDEVFGIHAVHECLKAKARQIDRICVAQGTSNRQIQEIIELARRSGISIKFEPRAFLDKRSDGGVHQGVVALCSTYQPLELEEILGDLTTEPFLVVLDSIEDPRNLGAILRCCAATGVDGVILPKDHSAGLSSTVSRTAAGALEHLRISRVTNLVRAFGALKERGVWIVGVETGQSKAYDELDYKMPLAIVLGNEGTGLRRLVRENCDFLVSIPTPGKVHSLNVSVAAGVVMYEVLRQRHSAITFVE